MIEQIYPLLILIGGTIGAVLAYLWRQARRANESNLALIRLNESLQFDTPSFLRAAWPLLSQAGLRGIVWKLDWYGITITEVSGKTDGKTMHRTIEVADMHLAVTFHQNRHGERRYFEEALIETFMLLLRTDMWIKAGAIDATFAQMARLTLFLQHDMKNVAQFIQLMADQLAAIPAGKEQKVLDYLRTSAPLMRHRADRIVRTLTAGQLQSESLRTIHLADEISQLCILHRLACDINGTAEVEVPENSLDRALDNILKNYADHAARSATASPRITVTIDVMDDDVRIVIRAADSAPVENIERLFEPFWSSTPEGLGIGLYQARQMLEICKGSLEALRTPAGDVAFCIKLPDKSRQNVA